MLVSEQRQDEKSTSYMIPTMWHLQKAMKMIKKVSDCQALRMGGKMNRQSTEDF